MKIRIERDVVSTMCVQGIVYVNDYHFGYSLERPYNIVHGISQKMSCIPIGIYEAKLMYSKAFKKLKIRLFDVPSREGILIHEGNTINETRGCILIGHYRKSGMVLESKIRVSSLEAMVHEAQNKGEVIEIEIMDISRKIRG